VNWGPPAATALGLIRLMTGAATTANVNAFETAPPETSVICAVPTFATKLAGTVAFTWVELTNTVASDVAFQRTTAPDANEVPVTVSVKAGLPAPIEVGLRLPMAGPETMVNVAAFEVTPPDETVICAVPGLAIRLANTGAVS